MFFDFVNDGRHVTLSATEVPSQNILGEFELNMSGLEEFDLVATPIHEYSGPSIGSTVLTPVAPPRALGSWARPSDAEYTEGRQIARRLAARGASPPPSHKSIRNEFYISAASSTNWGVWARVALVDQLLRPRLN